MHMLCLHRFHSSVATCWFSPQVTRWQICIHILLVFFAIGEDASVCNQLLFFQHNVNPKPNYVERGSIWIGGAEE